MQQSNSEYYPTTLARKAVTLVAHGLNMKPAGMLAIVQWLTAQGSDVYLVKLSGHFETAIPVSAMATALWEEEMYNAYTTAKKAVAGTTLPLYFVGYSFGALLGQALVCFSKEGIGFDKQILIAPATAIRSRNYLLKAFFFLGKEIMLPSYTPSPYRANTFLPLAAFEVLFRNEQNIIKAKFHQLNTPTLIFIDPKDELISYKKMRRYARLFSLHDVEIIALDSNLKARKALYHHLVVSEPTMGTQNWKMMTGRMAAFLFAAGS